MPDKDSSSAPTSATLTRWCVTIETSSRVYVTVEAVDEAAAIAAAKADLAGPWERAVEDPPDIDWPTAKAEVLP